MEVLARNERVGRLEIDIVAREGAAVAIVEVRSRGAGSWAGALASVDHAKQKKLRQAAERLWSRRLRHLPGVERVRFDVMAVDLDAEPPRVEHVRAAFV